MKKLLLACLSLGMLATFKAEAYPYYVQQVDVQFGQDRPFSFYYPYPNQYYYPRRQPMSCYWVNVNGVYVYQCH